MAHKKPLLHLVFGGRVKDPRSLDFENLEELDIVGVFPDFQSARAAWQGAAHRTVDDAMTKYVIVHLHRLLEPADDDSPGTPAKSPRGPSAASGGAARHS
ncbi:MAG: DUF4170 domain-containing protein [Pseudomonadota bacterium]|jgi:inhibitor of KinA sporulation pathway (predicted exonuclease)